MHYHLKLITCIALPIFATVGCGGGDGLVHVTGTIKYADGSPVTGEAAVVYFQTVLKDGIAAANGTIEPDGSFVLSTNRSDKGIQPAEYKVILQVWKDYKKGIPNVPRVYIDEATTPWQVTVSAEQRHFDLVIDGTEG